ncbi:MAG TPA: chloride channel protein [Polyangiaceae bacterium]|nr:chloride channel protein [Polyangiaceae bacterium]
MIPSTLGHPGARRFWLAVLLTGAGAGAGAAALTKLLEAVQRWAWGGTGRDLLAAASSAPPWRHVAVLAAAGVVTGAGQLLLVRLTSSNSIDITEAILFRAGRLPALRTMASAVLAIVVVAMGASLGREGSPKQVGAVLANELCDRGRLSDDERRLIVACGAGAGMAAAYGVPLGGALFALEVLRGALALRLILPALVTSMVATAVSWIVLPDAPTYVFPSYGSSASVLVWALLAGPIAGVVSVGYVRAVRWADQHRPRGWLRLVAPVVALGAIGALSIPFPQILGNGKDVSQLAFVGRVAPGLLVALVLLRPLATWSCVASGTPGGLFTPSLAMGALLGGLLGEGWSWIWPGAPPGIFAVVGAAAVLAATTQGPISSAVLMMELTGRDRSFILPMLLALATATVVARSIEPRSIYDARLTEDQIARRQKLRDQPVPSIADA